MNTETNDEDMGEYCPICYETDCDCDKEVNARFAARKITREEYRQASREDRSAPSAAWKPSLLMAHFSDVSDFLATKSLPPDLQYHAASQRYRDYLTGRLEDFNDTMQEMQLDRQTSHYHFGLD